MRQTLTESLYCLCRVTKQGLQTISISKSLVNTIPCSLVNILLSKIFTDSITKIKINCNQIVTSARSERRKIITENHSIAIGE